MTRTSELVAVQWGWFRVVFVSPFSLYATLSSLPVLLSKYLDLIIMLKRPVIKAGTIMSRQTNRMSIKETHYQKKLILIIK